MIQILTDLFNWGLHGGFWPFIGFLLVFWLICETLVSIVKYLVLLIGMMFLQKNTKFAETISKMYYGEVFGQILTEIAEKMKDKTEDHGTEKETSNS